MIYIGDIIGKMFNEQNSVGLLALHTFLFVTRGLMLGSRRGTLAVF